MKSILRNHLSGPEARPFATKIYALLALLITLVVVLLFGQHTDSTAQSLEKLNRFVRQTQATDSAMLMFTRGRDLIQAREYGEAVAQFTRFINENPRHKDVDAAIYWLAYSLTRTEKFAEADRQLARLLQDFPASNWTDDARSLRVQIAGQVRDTQTINAELDKDNNEIKRIALQSLFQADPERAATIVADILKPDSKADRRLKETAIMLLGQQGGAKYTDTLIAMARNETDTKLRRTAIFWLGQSGDPRTFGLLQELTKSDDAEIGKAALFALSQRNDEQAKQAIREIARGAQSTKLRREAIFWLAQRGDESVVDELIQLYGSEQDMEVKKHILFALTQSNSPRAAAKLEEIARSGGDAELRKQAIFWLGQRGDEQTLQKLIQMYDSEQDAKIREQLVFGFSQSHSKLALNKLLQIARSDSSVEMRKKAIFWLGQSKEPEAAKFIEEILK